MKNASIVEEQGGIAPPGDTTRQYVTPEQLCVGLYIHLDLGWTDHPFTFSSFKIKSPEQIATLRGLGLARIRYSAGRSDCAPAPGAAVSAGDPGFARSPTSNGKCDASDASGTNDTMRSDVSTAEQAMQASGETAASSVTVVPVMPTAAQVAPTTVAKVVDTGEQLRRIAHQHAKAQACQKELAAAAKAMRAIGQNVYARPAEAREAATELVRHIAGSMLVDADVSIRLMADKVGSEDVYFHALNVSLLSMMLAKELNASVPVMLTTGLGALFHDAGEAEIPARILRPTEALTRAETALFHMHSEYGANVSEKAGLPAEVRQVILQHHEKVDGSGYPKGIKAAHMSLPARIVSLVNAYDELCNPSNPALAMTPHEALSTLFAQQRHQYDALALGTFVRCMGVYPPGTIVQLSDQTTALVVSVNTAKPLRPVVMVHDATVPRERAPIVDLESEPTLSIKGTLRPQQLSQDAHAYLSPRKRVTYYFETEERQRKP